jgi:zinc transporter ZupT
MPNKLIPLLAALLVLAAGATLFVLARGVINMAQQKDITGQRSQQLMRQRILFQGIAVLIAVVLLLMASQ